MTLVEGASVSQWSQIVDGRIDIGMSRMQPPSEQSDIQSLSLGDEPLVAAISSDSPLAAQAQVTLAELSEHPLILFPADYGSGLNEAIEQLYRRNGLPLRPGPSGRQITSIIALVAAGQGIALVPRLHPDPGEKRRDLPPPRRPQRHRPVAGTDPQAGPQPVGGSLHGGARRIAASPTRSGRALVRARSGPARPGACRPGCGK